MADVVQRIRREHPSLLGHAASKDNVMPPPGPRCDVGREHLLPRRAKLGVFAADVDAQGLEMHEMGEGAEQAMPQQGASGSARRKMKSALNAIKAARRMHVLARSRGSSLALASTDSRSSSWIAGSEYDRVNRNSEDT